MHTFNGKEVTIHYDSDMGGYCDIIDKETEQGLTVPCEDILDFVANYVRSQRISKLEQMETKDIFGL